ncbi:MAG: MlaD family protein [Phycisphaerae bacterium]
MRERHKNFAVGLTIIGALVMLGAMIVIFAGLPELFRSGYNVHIVTDTTYSAKQGDAVHFAGMRVGQVNDVAFRDTSRPQEGVLITVRIDNDIKLPANTRAHFYSRGFMGGTHLELRASGEDAETAKNLPTDGSATVPALYEGSELVPKEFRKAVSEMSEGLGEFSRLAKNFNTLFEVPGSTTGPSTTGTATATAPSGSKIQQMLARLDRTLEGIETVVGDEDNQQNIKQSLANLASATEKANEAMDAIIHFAEEAKQVTDGAKQATTRASETLAKVGNAADTANRRIDEIADGIIKNAEEMSRLLMTIRKLSVKIDQGEGTAGRLINDPKLYNNLVEATAQMSRVMKDMRALVEEWKESGVPIKLR